MPDERARRKTYCALHFRPAMLAVRQYGCASRTELPPLATVFLGPDTTTINWNDKQ
jgi:hypothetical protein